MASLSKKQNALLSQITEASNDQNIEQDKRFLVLDPSTKSDLDAIHARIPLKIGSYGDNQIAVQLEAALPNGAATENPEVNQNWIDFSSAKDRFIPPPVTKTGRKGETQYPFAKMEVGDHFLMPVSARYPKPWETFASTVSSATRRFAQPSSTETRIVRGGAKKGQTIPKLVPTRIFTLRRVKKGDVYPNGYVEVADGARIWRIQ